MTDKLTEYTFILPDGSKRYEFVASMKELRAFMKMHGAKSAAPTAMESTDHWRCPPG